MFHLMVEALMHQKVHRLAAETCQITLKRIDSPTNRLLPQLDVQVFLLVSNQTIAETEVMTG